MPTCQGLFYVLWLGNHIHCKFIFAYIVVISFDGLFFILISQTDLFDPEIEPWLALSLQVREDLGIMAMKFIGCIL